VRDILEINASVVVVMFTTALECDDVKISASDKTIFCTSRVSVHTGAGKLVKMYIELFSNINKTVVSDIIITAICISALLLVKVCINERFKERLKMPIPIDLIVVIAATVISHFGKLESNVGVSVIGNIRRTLEEIGTIDQSTKLLVT
jgi:hypothetical protein